MKSRTADGHVYRFWTEGDNLLVQEGDAEPQRVLGLFPDRVEFAEVTYTWERQSNGQVWGYGHPRGNPTLRVEPRQVRRGMVLWAPDFQSDPLVEIVEDDQAFEGLTEEDLDAAVETAMAATAQIRSMRAVCAYCQGELPPIPCSSEQVEEVSHGICPACFEKQTGHEPNGTLADASAE